MSKPSGNHFTNVRFFICPSCARPLVWADVFDDFAERVLRSDLSKAAGHFHCMYCKVNILWAIREAYEAHEDGECC